jgi:hypothetical protein
VNRHYNHPSIPIGIRKGNAYFSNWSYSKPIADRFYHQLTNDAASDATVLYRQLLSRSADTSITIITIGPLMNIQNLLQSGADSISLLTGKQLIEKKVKTFVIMGGQFPVGKSEWNFNGEMPGVTQFVISNITVPVVFSGFELGVLIKTGEVFNTLDSNSLFYIGEKYFSEHAPWMKDQYQGKVLANASYDQTAVLYAVRNGLGIYWDKVEGGYCKPDEKGGNIWVSGPVTNHAYLKLKMDPVKMALLIESIMLNHF